MTLQKRYLLGFLGVLAFAACDPMDDVYKELHIDDEGIKKDMKLTLSDDDYAILKNIEGAPSYTYNSHYFESDEEAAQYIPTILNEGYPQLRDASTALITFNRMVYDFSNDNEVSSTELYTVKKEDYLLTGEDPRNANFNSPADLINFLDIKYDSGADTAANFSLKILTYDYYSGSARTIVKPFYKVAGQWTDNTYLVTQEDYESTGHNYHDYQASDLPNLPSYFNRFLSAQISLATAAVGDVINVVYYYYDGETKNTIYQLMAMMYDGTKWNEVTETTTEPVELNFVKNSGIWEANLTKNYTLAVNDYTWIATNATVGSDAAKSNLGQYKNFAVSTWGQDNIDLALGQLLNHLFPNDEVGTQYNVIYDQYSSGVSTTNILMEKQASGEWTKVTVTEN